MSDQQIKTFEIESACPFLLCCQTGPHSHSICPECGTVRHGNIYCKNCRDYSEELRTKEDGRTSETCLDFKTLLRQKTKQLENLTEREEKHETDTGN